MMFRFNFDNEKEEVDKSEKYSEIEWYQCEEVKVSPEIEEFVFNVPNSELKKMCYGNDLPFFTLASTEIMKRLKQDSEKDTFLDAMVADEQHSDLVPGKYEGGLKTWECTKDLALYFFTNVIEKSSRKLEGKHVLDLGCGTGILGILAAQNGANVTFQDYNKEVLEMMTIPNVLLNCQNWKGKVSFYSGDWSFFTNLLVEDQKKDSKFDYILTSETIYNVENYGKLIGVFKKLSKSEGVIYVAAKSHYFGVGGTLYEFINELDNNNFDCKIVWETEEGVLRKVIEVRSRQSDVHNQSQ